MIVRPQFIVLVAGLVAITSTGCKKNSNATGSRDVGMASAEAVKISDVQLGRRVGADKRVADKTDTFSPRDTIYASVATSGSAPSATITARWTFENGQVVKEDTRTIAPNGSEATEFHISKPSGWPKGKYKLDLSVGGSTETKDFEVK
jgi:hypothetical protein